MQEQNFEKQVQQKMEELAFVPSEPVWQKVEAQIKGKKDRRRLIFWLLPLVLLGGGYFVWSVTNRQSIGNHSSASIITSTAPNNHSSSTSQNNTSQSRQTQPLNENVKKVDVIDKKNEVSEGPPNELAHKERTINSRIEQKQTKPNVPVASKSVIEQSNTVSKEPIQTEGTEIAINENETATPVTQQNADVAVTTIPSAPDSSLSASKDSTTTLQSSSSITDSSAQVPKVVQAARIKKTWIVSVRASVGISSLSDDLNMFRSIVGTQNKSLNDLYSGPFYSPAPGVNFSNAAPIAMPPSPVYNGIAYSAGLDLRRALGKRLDIISGISYQYFSTMHYVGRKVDNRAALSNQFSNTRISQEFYLNNSAAQSKYKTNYHYLTVPLAVDYLLLKKKPLHIEAGIQVAQLLSTNALYYDRAAVVYYENRGIFRNTQLFGTTGLNYRVLSGKGGSLYVGPQVQFGFTNLLAKKENGQQHLLSAGVTTRFTF